MKKKQEYIKQLADANGIYHIFAIDHRDVFVDELSKAFHHVATFEEIVAKKQALMNIVAPLVSGYLIDPIYGIKEDQLSISTNQLPFMMGIENSNYDLKAMQEGYLYEGITIDDIKTYGGSMVKLFVYYHPVKEIGKSACEIIAQVSERCKEIGIPFLLEPILYSEEELSQKQRYKLTKMMLEQLKQYPIDIYKLAFPGDIETCSEVENIATCRAISELLETPWIVLSSGVSSEVFMKQIEFAGKGGACGYAVGRSVWGSHLGTSEIEATNMYHTMEAIVQCANKFCCSVEKK